MKSVKTRDRLMRTPDGPVREHVNRSSAQAGRSPAQVGRSATQVRRSPARSQPPAGEGRSPTFYAVQKSRKSSMANYKTPKTLISEFLEGQKTQTAQGQRHREVLVRTPDDSVNSSVNQVRSPVRSPARGGRSPGRVVKHDRVSSLRGKRTRSLTSLADENTPRTMIEGFLAGEDTTAPVVRRLRRTSQSGFSASQPVMSSAKRQTSAQTSTLESMDTETPRTLIQGFLRNATNVIETPVVMRDETSPDVSPNALVIPDAQDYHTPSPFKSSSQSDTSNVTRSAKRSEPRKPAGSYHIPVQVQESRSEGLENSSMSDIIQPTSPGSNASYQVPSAFLSSPESTMDLPVSQSQGTRKHREGWNRRASLNLSFLGPIVRDTYQVSPRSAHVHQGEDNSDIDEEQVIPETQQERDKTLHEERDNTLQEERDNTLQEDHIIYNLPMKDISRENTDDYDDEYDSGDLQRSRSKRSTGQSRMSSIEAYRRASDFDQSRKISTDSHVERLSINRSRRSEVIADRSDGFNGGEKENMDFDRMSNVSHGSLHSTRSHNSSRSSVISYQDEVRVDRQRMREEIDRRRSSDGEIIRKRRMDNLDELIADNGEYLNDSFDAMYERHVAREGRWSEGHLLKERRPSYAGPGRYSEGHLVQGQGHLVQGKGERSFSQQGVHRSIENPPARSVSKRRSSISANNSIESSLDLTPSFRSRPPRDHDLESQGHGMSRSRQRETSIDEVDGYGTENSNLESRSKRQHVSGHRSFHGHDEEGHDVYVDNDDRISPSRPGHVHTLPDNTASFSPTVASTQRLNFQPRHSPSPRTADALRQRQRLNDDVSRFSPRISSTQKAQSFNDGSMTVIARKQQGRVEGLPDNTASFSPRIASTQRLHTSIGKRVDDGSLDRSSQNYASPRGHSPLDGASPLDQASPIDQSSPLDQASTLDHPSPLYHVSPLDGASPLDHASPLDGASPLDHASPSPVVSPQRDSMSPSRTLRSIGQRTRTPSSSTSMTKTPRSSTSTTKTPRSSTSMTKTPRSSTSMTKTPRSSASMTMTPRSSTQQTRTPGSHRSASLRSSKLKTSSGGMRTVSSGSSGRGSQMTEGERSQSRLNESISRFSPRMSSTKRGHSISEAGAADAGEKEPSQLRSQSLSDTAANVSPGSDRDTAIREPAIPPKKKRSPNKKSQYSIPVSIVKKNFTRFAGMRVSKEAIEEVMKISEVYWDNLASDLEAYALHAGRKRINMDDFILLFKRQGLINEKQCMNSLIEKYLPMEERQTLIPVARAYNRIEPKL